MKHIQYHEKFMRDREHRLCDRFDYKGLKIVITDGGPYYLKEKKDYPG